LQGDRGLGTDQTSFNLINDIRDIEQLSQIDMAGVSELHLGLGNVVKRELELQISLAIDKFHLEVLVVSVVHCLIVDKGRNASLEDSFV
jgi:hypothetical protein